MWFGAGAPPTVLEALIVCSVFGLFTIVIPLLESVRSGVASDRKGSDKGSTRWTRMGVNSWNAIKNIGHGVTGSLLVQSRRNESKPR